MNANRTSWSNLSMQSPDTRKIARYLREQRRKLKAGIKLPNPPQTNK